jgi:hypothetical protein
MKAQHHLSSQSEGVFLHGQTPTFTQQSEEVVGDQSGGKMRLT